MANSVVTICPPPQENKEYLKQEETILQRVDQDVDYDIEGDNISYFDDT